ncbi:CYTH domain-containing protein [Solimonas terrae]|uniref:CYTH domain-containing protein n=1 Tax=Solimonas terrae TaxID=1396819 RepID=A0A6M2BQH0_9GAMM|nr:CYTH domain-containing protein [Solimonas terrae]NGY04455.1 CYTH domain-containing protein [Solimonas terrae]
MPLEIERKFLVIGDAWRQDVTRSIEMRQGYLAREGQASVRVRLEGAVARLNIKAAVVGSARAEYEYNMPADECREILATLCVGKVEKTRHYVPASGAHASAVWEIDEFAGDNAGLLVAEIELASIDARFDRPSWLGRELTDDKRYYNHALALHPYRDWPAQDRA